MTDAREPTLGPSGELRQASGAGSKGPPHSGDVHDIGSPVDWNGVQLLGALVGVIGLVLSAMGYSDLIDSFDDTSTSQRIQYVLATGLPTLVGAGLLFGVGLILKELRSKH